MSHSPETIEKIRQTQLRKIREGTFKYAVTHGLTPWNKGLPRSQAVRDAVSRANKGRKHAPEVNARKGSPGEKNPMYGRKHTTEALAKMRDAKQGKYVGAKHPLYGKPRPAHVREQIAQKLEGVFALEKNPAWLGGKSYEPYPLTWTRKLRNAVRKRDNYTCQECGAQPQKTLCVHHIDYNKHNCATSNLISLCVPCHAKTNFTREDWRNRYEQAMRERNN